MSWRVVCGGAGVIAAVGSRCVIQDVRFHSKSARHTDRLGRKPTISVGRQLLSLGSDTCFPCPVLYNSTQSSQSLAVLVGKALDGSSGIGRLFSLGRDMI